MSDPKALVISETDRSKVNRWTLWCSIGLFLLIAGWLGGSSFSDHAEQQRFHDKGVKAIGTVTDEREVTSYRRRRTTTKSYIMVKYTLAGQTYEAELEGGGEVGNVIPLLVIKDQPTKPVREAWVTSGLSRFKPVRTVVAALGVGLLGAAISSLFIYLRLLKWFGKPAEPAPATTSQHGSESTAPLTPAPANKHATWALICGLFGFCFPPLTLAGVILGHMGWSRAKATGYGRGRAIAGLSLSYLQIAACLAFLSWVAFSLN